MARQESNRDAWSVELLDLLLDGHRLSVREIANLLEWPPSRVRYVVRYLRDILPNAVLSTRGKNAVTWVSEDRAEADQYGRQERRIHAVQVRNVAAEVQKLGGNRRLVRQLRFIADELGEDD